MVESSGIQAISAFSPAQHLMCTRKRTKGLGKLLQDWKKCFWNNRKRMTRRPGGSEEVPGQRWKETEDKLTLKTTDCSWLYHGLVNTHVQVQKQKQMNKMMLHRTIECLSFWGTAPDNLQRALPN